jgi:hypothetical protein
MRPSVRLQFFSLAVMLATSLLAFSTVAARGQDDPFAPDAVVAQGDPPLTENMITRFTNFQSWLLEIPFTQEQRERVRAMLLQDWTKPQEIKNDMIWLKIAQNLAPLPPPDREFARIEIQPQVLKDLRADNGNPDSRWLVGAYDDAQRTIVAGTPPLTESLVARFIAFHGWLFEIPVTPSLRQRLRTMLVEDWKKPKDMESDMAFVKWETGLAHHTPAEREYVRSLAQPELIKKMRADGNNADAKMLVAAYDAARQPIAAGNPPLTRQASDAWTELFCFIRNQSGGALLEATPALKDEFARSLTESYPKDSPEKQKSLSEMPQKLALVRYLWMKGTEADRHKILAAWQPIVNPSQPSDPQLAAATDALARVDAFKAKDPNTVSEKEMLSAAKDADLVALQYRRQGSKRDVVDAEGFEELSRTLHTGNKQAYVNLMAQWKANGEMLAVMRAQFAAKSAMRNAAAIGNAYAVGDAAMANVIANINPKHPCAIYAPPCTP